MGYYLVSFLLSEALEFCLAECSLEESQASPEFQYHKILSHTCGDLGRTQNPEGPLPVGSVSVGKAPALGGAAPCSILLRRVLSL